MRVEGARRQQARGGARREDRARGTAHRARRPQAAPDGTCPTCAARAGAPSSATVPTTNAWSVLHIASARHGLPAVLQVIDRQGFRAAHVVATPRAGGLWIHLLVEGSAETGLLLRLLARLEEVREVTRAPWEVAAAP